ncbi:hypothetical protein ACFQY7_26760 [Actinomadura luteofluorescens]
MIGVGLVLLVGGGLFWTVRRRGPAAAQAAPERDETAPSEPSRKG